MKYQIAPIWFSSFFEKDRVALTKREIRGAHGIVKALNMIGFTTLFSNYPVTFFRDNVFRRSLPEG